MDPIEMTRQWVEQFVIALNLCPFAATPFRKDQIRYVLEETDSPEVLVKTYLAELAFLLENPAEKVETTLIIHPHVLNDFSEYNDFLGLADELLDEAGLSGFLQLASFHPDYRFEGVPQTDPANYTNRSPFPMLHILREESVGYAVDNYPDPERIPERNMDRLREMGEEQIRHLLSGFNR